MNYMQTWFKVNINQYGGALEFRRTYSGNDILDEILTQNPKLEFATRVHFETGYGNATFRVVSTSLECIEMFKHNFMLEPARVTDLTLKDGRQAYSVFFNMYIPDAIEFIHQLLNEWAVELETDVSLYGVNERT